jgi:hypothetical protein
MVSVCAWTGKAAEMANAVKEMRSQDIGSPPQRHQILPEMAIYL